MKSSLRNITRMNYGTSKGWWFRTEGKEYTSRKLFSDSKYGGRAKALKAAQKFRDHVLDTHPEVLPIPRLPGKGSVSRKFVTYKSKCGSFYCTYEAVVAWITIEPGRTTSNRYAIGKRGVNMAYRKANEWLEKKRKEQARNYRRLGIRL